MKKLSVLIILLGFFLLILPLTNFVSAADYAPGEILVGFNENVTEQQAIDLIEGYNLDLLTYYKFNGWLPVGVPVGEEGVWIDVLTQEDIVNYAELNFIVVIDDPPSPPIPPSADVASQWDEVNLYILIGGILVVGALLFLSLRMRRNQ
ncbi:MAG: hypothetical protein KC516_03955 [Nanoarchaeota archaeon]|nr:hypothetical protein [Nanoarchaeota archaeon]